MNDDGFADLWFDGHELRATVRSERPEPQMRDSPYARARGEFARNPYTLAAFAQRLTDVIEMVHNIQEHIAGTSDIGRGEWEWYCQDGSTIIAEGRWGRRAT